MSTSTTKLSLCMASVFPWSPIHRHQFLSPPYGRPCFVWAPTPLRESFSTGYHPTMSQRRSLQPGHRAKWPPAFTSAPGGSETTSPTLRAGFSGCTSTSTHTPPTTSGSGEAMSWETSGGVAGRRPQGRIGSCARRGHQRPPHLWISRTMPRPYRRVHRRWGRHTDHHPFPHGRRPNVGTQLPLRSVVFAGRLAASKDDRSKRENREGLAKSEEEARTPPRSRVRHSNRRPRSSDAGRTWRSPHRCDVRAGPVLRRHPRGESRPAPHQSFA